jgi:5-methyltetrahydrofolate--homocysteine methyltransferase
MDETIKTIFEAVLQGDKGQVEKNIQIALDLKMDSTVILSDGMIAAMREVGKRFEAGDYYVPEMLICAQAMQAGMVLLKPHLQRGNEHSNGKVVIGTVKGDLHSIGKNLVALMLEGAGFEVKDLGIDVAAEDIVAAIRKEQPDILALSALLTTTMATMKQTIDEIQAAGLRDKIKIMVGGAPVTEKYAQQIGADGYSPDASRAVGLAESLMKN